MPFLPGNLVTAGWGAFGHSPWIWPAKLPDGGSLIINKADRAGWDAAFTFAALSQAGKIAGLVVTPVAPAPFYSFNFDTGQLLGPYPVGRKLWPELPSEQPDTVGFTITDPTTGLTRPLEGSDINQPKPLPPPPTSPISPVTSYPPTGTIGGGTPIAGPLGDAPDGFPVTEPRASILPTVQSLTQTAATDQPSASPAKHVLWLIGAVVLGFLLLGG